MNPRISTLVPRLARRQAAIESETDAFAMSGSPLVQPRLLAGQHFTSIVIILLTLASRISAPAATQSPLTTLEYKITGSQLRVTPTNLVVPKGIAGSVLPQILSGDSTNRAASSELTQGAYIEATLRGPSFEARRVLGRPNEALLLPPLNLVGDYQLDNIRLVDADTGAVRLEGVPSSVPVRVFAEVLVSRVVSRPLTLDEIRERGIVIDENNFRAVEFEVMFVLEGQSIPIRFPVVAPAFSQSTEIIPAAELEARLVQAAAINQQIASEFATVPPAFEAAGIDLQIQGINFQIVEEADIDLALSIPPIPALMVIPGNIGFLNQFFSVQIFTENAAPLNSGLSVNHVLAKLNLPPASKPPLRFARLGPDKTNAPVQQVVRPGSDGKVGTDDDIERLAPGESGQAEFLVEGLLEGLHVLNLDLTADLEGLAAGVVKIKGKAAGSVLVRNPRFSLAFSHPRTVRFGERYEASVTVMNTGLTPANEVSVMLGQVDGATFEGDQQETVKLGTILPGESTNATYRLRSQRTGRITFSNLTTGDASVQGHFRLHVGVDERGVALSPDTIAMPEFVNHLPKGIVDAAQRVLGQALSAATAAQLPPGILRTPRSVITTRVLELAEAGQRLRYHDGLHRVLPDLLLDWQGGRSYNAAFDQILRETEAGREWRAALVTEIERTNSLHATERLEERAADLAGLGQAFVLASGNTGQVSIVFGDGKQGAVPESSTQPRALVYDGARGDWGVTPFNSNAVVAWTFPSGATNAELGVLFIEANGTARQYRWTVTNALPSAVYRYALAETSRQLLVDFDGGSEAPIEGASNGVTRSELTLLAVEQDLTVNAGRPRDASRCIGPSWENYGTVVAVVFSRPVSQETAGNPASYVLDNGNGANSVQIQPSGRVALINLRQGISAIQPRRLSLTGIMDACGGQVADCTRDVVSVFKGGVTIKGRVVRGDGRVATNVPVTLTMYDQAFNEFDASCESRVVRISQVFTDSRGDFEFEFVMAGIPYSVSATDTSDLSQDVVALILQAASRDEINRALLLQLANSPENQDTLLQAFAVAALPQAIAKVEGLDRAVLHDFVSAEPSNPRLGQSVPMVLRFRGRATVIGQIVAEDGVTTVPGAAVNLFPDPDSREMGRGLFADSDGKFAFFGVPLGVFTVDVKTSDGRSRIVAGVLNMPAQVTNILVALPQLGLTTARTTVRGRVIDPEGTNGQANARVYVGQYAGGSRVLDVAAIVTADATGFWDAPNVPLNTYDVVAVSFDGRRKGVRQRIPTTPNAVTHVNLTLESTATVTVEVRDSLRRSVQGAWVGGGEALVQTGPGGSVTLQGVPLGRRSFTAVAGRTNTIPSFDFPRTGSASLDVVSGLENRVVLPLQVAGRIVGTVYDANGMPVGRGMRVAIPREGGFWWTETDAAGRYTFENLPPGTYVVSAPANAVFQTDTSGLIEQIRTGDAADIFDAIREAYAIFAGITDPFLTGEHLLFNPITWGFTRVSIQFEDDPAAQNANIFFRKQGTVIGTVLNHQNVPIGARVRVTGVGPRANGEPAIVIRGEVNSDPATGRFAFPEMVLQGPYTLQVASPFYSVVVSENGEIGDTPGDLLREHTLKFPAPPPSSSAGVVRTGWLAGVVLNTNGLPVGEGFAVTIAGIQPQLQTDTRGEFRVESALPVGRYAVEVIEVNDEERRGLSYMDVRADMTNRVTVTLLGYGRLRVKVFRSDGLPAPGASVYLERATYPANRPRGGLSATNDAQGELLFAPALFEGSYSVCAELGAGATFVSGRASAVVTRDATNEVTVRLSATGTLEGLFVKRDRTTPIPSATVAIGSIGYASTDSNGFFRITGVPPGQYRLRGSDPVTGVGAAATATVVADRTNSITLVEQSRGEINGRVLGSYRDAYVPGAEVVLTVFDGITPGRTVTTGPRGEFSFPGAPAGVFRVTATEHSALALSGSMQGVLPEDSPSVTVEIVLEPFGILPVQVRRSDGQTIATNVDVTLTSPFAGARVEGLTITPGQETAFFRNLRLGVPYTLNAASLDQPNRAARATVALTAVGTNPTSILTLSGAGTVRGTFVGSGGAPPLPGERVTLRSEAALFAGATFVTNTGTQGKFEFLNVPVGGYFLTASSDALGGLGASLRGAMETDGQIVTNTLQLIDSGSITGTLVRADGTNPVSGVIVLLKDSDTLGLLGIVLSSTNGAFRFDSIPLRRFIVEAAAGAFGGLARVRSEIMTNGQLVDLGRVFLDEDFPRVVEVTPLPGAVNVPTTNGVALRFNEALDPATVRGDGIFLRPVGTGAVIAAALSIDPTSNVWVRLTLAGGVRLRSKTDYEALVLRYDPDFSPRGPRDRVGRPLLAPFISRFTTEDSDPPFLISMSPTNGQVQVAPYTLVNEQISPLILSLTFSEEIRPTGFVFTVNGPAGGREVRGRAVVGLDGRKLVFAPELADGYEANSTYTFSVSNVVDLAGNRMSNDTITATFVTVDNRGPTNTLRIADGARPVAGSTITIEALLEVPETNVTFRFSQDLNPLPLATNATNRAKVTLPTNGFTIVRAIAADRYNNEGPSSELRIDVESNAPPAVSLTRGSPDSGSVSNGQVFRLIVSGSDDDVGVTNLSLVGAGAFSFATNFSHSATNMLHVEFDLVAPSEAMPGAVVFHAQATDELGLRSVETNLTIEVKDGARPMVAINSPPADSVLTSNQLDLVVISSDNGASHQLEVTLSGALTATQTNNVASAPLALVTNTFSFLFNNAPTNGATLTATVRAIDSAGNSSADSRIFRFPDLQPPQLLAANPTNGAVRQSLWLSAVRFDFDESLDPVTATTNVAVANSTGEITPFTVSLANGNSSLVVSNSLPLLPGESYTNLLSPGLTDPSGNHWQNIGGTTVPAEGVAFVFRTAAILGINPTNGTPIVPGQRFAATVDFEPGLGAEFFHFQLNSNMPVNVAVSANASNATTALRLETNASSASLSIESHRTGQPSHTVAPITFNVRPRDQDDDGDGMTNWFEADFDLNPFDPSDAGLDPDMDGLTNLQEFRQGTNPMDPRDGTRSIVTFSDKAAFIAASGATNATGPLPNAPSVGQGPYTIGSVTFTAAAANQPLHFGDWTARLQGNDLAISGNEDLNVALASPVFSLGFDFVEPKNDPQVNAPFVDSTFTVALFSGLTRVGIFTFSAPDDTAAFVGVWSQFAFDRVEIRETVGAAENEFYGQFYTGGVPLGSLVFNRNLEFNVDGVFPTAETNIQYFGPQTSQTTAYSVSGGLLHQRTFGTVGAAAYTWPNVNLTGSNLSPTLDFSMEARLMVSNVNGFLGVYFGAANGAHRYLCGFTNGGVHVIAASGFILVPFPDIANFHIYRIESPGGSGTFRLFIDGTLAFDGIAPTSTQNGFEWGDVDTLFPGAGGGDADWDYVRVSQRFPYSTSCVAAPPGLVAWWPGNGNGNDISGTNHGALSNGVIFSSGIVDQGFDFDGVGGFFTGGDVLDLGTESGSIELWYRRRSDSPSSSVLIVKGLTSDGTPPSAGYGILVRNGLLSGSAYDGSPPFATILTPEPSADVWHHVALVIDRQDNQLRLYSDGTLAGTQFIGGLGSLDSNIPLSLGAFHRGIFGITSDFFGGQIDEVAIYNRALTSNEITAIYVAGSAGKCGCAVTTNGLVAWWPGDINGSDLTGAHHGTLQNGVRITNGVVGDAFSFDGSDSYLSVPDSPVWDFGMTDFTIELWVKLNRIKDSMFIHQQSGSTYGGFEFHFTVRGSNRLIFNRDPFNNAIARSWFPATNVWYHLAVSREHGVYRFYLNGQQWLDGQFDPNSITNVSGPLRIGDWAGGEYPLDGLIDELSIYHRALSALEIQAIVNACGSGKCRDGIDSDSDGLSNGFELANGLNPFDPDTDRDGILDGVDVAPLDPNSPFLAEGWLVGSSENAPGPRRTHAIVWTGREMIVWGGWDGTNLLNTGGRYDPFANRWTPLSTNGAPSGRQFPSAVWTGTEMIIWGGYTNTGARYNPTSNTWTPMTTNGAPPARAIAGLVVWTGSEMLIWGGYGYENATSMRFNTGGRYNPSRDTWATITTNGVPSARSHHTAIWTGTEMIIWGGSDDTSYFNTGGRYNLATDTWTNTATANAPVGRWGHAAVWTGREMIVWGGWADESVFSLQNTGGRYDPSSDTWLAVPIMGAPSARGEGHTLPVVWTGREMIIWGGFDTNGVRLNTGGRYNPAANSWGTITTIDAPAARREHEAVWTGHAMILFGGWDSGDVHLSDTHVYTPPQTVPASLGCAYPPQGLIGWWPGDDSANDIASTNHGALLGGATNASGLVGKGFGLNGVDAAVDIGPLSSLAGAQELTVLAWIKWTNGASLYPAIVGKWHTTPCDGNNSFLLYTGENTGETGTRSNGFFALNFDDNTCGYVFGTRKLPLGEWVFLAGTWSANGTLVLYKNGAPENSSTVGAGKRLKYHTAFNAKIGDWGFDWGTNGRFAGAIDEVAIFNRALSGAEIHAIYSAGSAGMCKPDGDADRDGMPNGWETANGLNPFSDDAMLDTDGDGLNNLAEFQSGTNPRNPDSDGDGILDGADVSPLNPNSPFLAESWREGSNDKAPTPRSATRALWTGSEMMIWGGYDGSTPTLNSGGRYDPRLNRWTTIPTNGAPSRRYHHLAVWTGSEMIIWGGSDTTKGLNTGARYSPLTDLWTPISTNGAPPAGSGPGVWTGSELLVWGGGSGDMAKGGRYTPTTDTWTPMSLNEAPSPRTGHTIVWTGNEVVIWGGNFNGSTLNTGARYFPATDSWLPITLTNVPERRFVHAAIWSGTEMIIWGGRANDAISSGINTGGRYNPTSDAWARVTAVGAPSARSSVPFSAVWTGKEMIIWGGHPASGSPTVRTGGRYDPVADSWVPTTLTGAPPSRSNHQMIWTGENVILFGGDDGVATYLAAPYLYTPPRTVPSCVSPPAGLVSWWPGDGIANDLSGANHGELQRGATFAPGLVGEAFYFDGQDDSVLIRATPSLRINGDFTIEFWFRPAQIIASNGHTFFSKGSVDSIGVANESRRIEVRGPSPRPTSTTSNWYSNAWYHVAVTYTPSGYGLFINGRQEGNATVTNYSILANSADIRFGSQPQSRSPFGGTIDEFAIYSRALTANDISAIYAAGSAGMCKSPLIAIQPTNQQAFVGANVTLSVTATGSHPLNFQWWKDGAILFGQTNSTVILPSVRIEDQGTYSVVVTNTAGSIMSSNAILVVVAGPPQIVLEPRSVNAGIGVEVQFEAVVTDGLSYEWLFFSTNLSSGISIPSASGPLLRIASVTNRHIGAYQLRVTNSIGSVLSDKAWLILTNNTDNLPFNTTVAQPPVTVLLNSQDPDRSLPYNTFLAQPQVSIFLTNSPSAGAQLHGSVRLELGATLGGGGRVTTYWIQWHDSTLVLQSSTNLAVWVDIPHAAAPYQIPTNRAGTEFFRLRYPSRLQE